MMIWDNNRITNLYTKFVAKEASAAELDEFIAFLNSPDAEERMTEMLDAHDQVSSHLQKDLNELRARQIFEHIVDQPQEIAKTRKLWLTMAGIAAVAAIVVVSFLIINGSFNGDGGQGISVAYDVPPGTNGAMLTMSDGQKIALSAANSKLLLTESGVRISKTAAGEITYEIIDNLESKRAGKNTLSTDSGQTYRVKLPDGSMVWLNAASSLRYPVSFASSKRRVVQLSGEAYFEIQKDANRPFVVESKDQSVTVLGTHFNIKAYEDDKAVTTTLEEGSVRVGYQASAWGAQGKIHYKDEITLSPGQKSLLKNGTVNISKANLQENLAWKEGDFIFYEVGIDKVMQDIARWYRIEVIYEEGIPGGTFSGNVSRTKNISQILLALESTKLVHFKVKGRKVYVTK